MWQYEKTLQYPVKIKNPDPKAASIIISQLGGPQGELGAAMRYLNQRYSMPYNAVQAALTDIGSEELNHLEMIGAIIHQLTRNLTVEEIKAGGFDTYFVDHTTGVYPTAASGYPFSTSELAVTGDPIADLSEDMAAEQKARLTYDNILRLVDDPDVKDVIRFLRAREIVHFQRFGESLQIVTDNLEKKISTPAIRLSIKKKGSCKQKFCSCLFPFYSSRRTKKVSPLLFPGAIRRTFG